MAQVNWRDPELTPEEKTAKLVLSRFAERPPVNVRRIASEFASIKEVTFPVSCDAVTIREPGDRTRPKILLNTNSTKFEPRKRFAISREIGHIKIPWHCGSIACHVDESIVTISDDHYSYEAEARRFASELLMPADWVRQVIEEELTIEKIFNKVVGGAEVSCTAARIKLMKLLPPGFIYAEVRPTTGEIVRIDESRKGCLSLFIEPGDRSSSRRLAKALEFYSVDRWIFPQGSTATHWWRLDSHCEIPEAREIRSSVEILRGIAEYFFESREEQNQAIYLVNGYASDGYQKAPFATENAIFRGIAAEIRQTGYGRQVSREKVNDSPFLG